MKIINLIRAQRALIFGETFYLIDIYDEKDPYTIGKSLEEQDDFGDRFQKHFETMLNDSNFDYLLSLIPYFSWLDLASYWDMNFSFMHAIESRPEYTETKMQAFYHNFNFRENDMVYDLKNRLHEVPVFSENEILLTYFPNETDPIYEGYKNEIDASIISKIEEISALDSAYAWCNIIPLMDENYTNENILQLIFEKQESLPRVQKIILQEMIKQSPINNPLVRYWL